MSVQTILRDELVNELDELSKVEFGSEKYKTAVAGVTQLTDRLIELGKLDTEDERVEIEKQKLDLEYQKLDDDRKDRKAKNRISVFGVVTPAAIAVV